jgi:hypothetical protein
MNSQDFEIFYNWNNSLKTNDKIQFRKIQSEVKTLRKAYSSTEIEEILVAEGYKPNLVKEALNFDSQDETIEQKVVEVSTVPKKYADVSSKFEKVLMEIGPTKFVKMLTSGSSPLMKISKKEIETFQKIADVAYENSVHLVTLHAYMKPSIVSELAENVCRARKIKNKCSFANTEGGLAITFNGKTVVASTKPVKSSSAKCVDSNYEKFGFPDEFVILAYEKNSPYSKIANDLN